MAIRNIQRFYNVCSLRPRSVSLHRAALAALAATLLVPLSASATMRERSARAVDPIFGYQPAFSRDGSRMAWVAGLNPGGIYVAGADASNLRQLTADRTDADPSFSPDGSTIVFDRQGKAPGIYAVGVDGSGLRRVTDPAQTPDGLLDASPSWSTSNVIVFARAILNEGMHLYTVRPDATGLQASSICPTGGGTCPDVIWAVSWAPDAHTLTFGGSYGYPGLWVADAATGEVRQLLDIQHQMVTLTPHFSSDGRRIVFSSTTSHGFIVWSINADGSGLRRITRGGTLLNELVDAVWTPGDAGVAMAGPGGLFVANPDGTDFREFAAPPGSGQNPTTGCEISRFSGDANPWGDAESGASHPLWTSDNKIMFEGVASLWIMNRDGSGGRRLARGIGAPTLSVDGRYLYFKGSLGLCRAKLDGSERTRITDDVESTLRDPSVAPVGTIAFTKLDGAGRSGQGAQIWQMDTDGNNWRQITGVEGRDPLPGAWGDSQPAWSPDGKRLAFLGFPCDVGQSGGVCPGRLYVINADGTGRRALTAAEPESKLNGESLADPAWSPDGTRVLFTAEPGTVLPAGTPVISGNALFVVGANGGTLTQLTLVDGHPAHCGYGVTSPHWSPDGKQIVFVGSCDAKYGSQVYVMNADGAGITRLTGRDLRAAPCEDSGCRITGTSGNDNLVGSEGRDEIRGGAGNDTIRGLGGVDDLRGGPGNDLIDGGPGNDTLEGDGGTDVLIAGEGDDMLFGGPGIDRFNGGAGNDIINSQDGKAERVDCGSGKDMLIADKLDRANGCERIIRH